MDERKILEEVNELESKVVKRNILENEFVDKANETFEQNMLSFKKYFPDIFEKFFVHIPSQKFNLFVNPNGTGNLVDYDTEVPLYSEDPVSQAKKQVENSIKAPYVSSINYSHLEHLENTEGFTHVDLITKLGGIYNRAKEKLGFSSEEVQTIPSVVIFGIGLGYHLLEILERIDTKYISIFEPHEDYFFASLFVCDWSTFLKKCDDEGLHLYISIGEKADEIYEVLYKRAQDLGPFTISNSLYFQHYPSIAVSEIVSKIRDNFHQFFMGWGFFDDAMMSLSHTLANLKKEIQLVRLDKAESNCFKDYPVCIVANGPSLDTDLEFLVENQSNFIIMSCNSATTALIKKGIVPDFHIALERTKETYDLLKEMIDEELRNRINLLTVNVMYPDVDTLFRWTGYGLKGREAGTSLQQIAEVLSGNRLSATLAYCNPLVGNTALSFANAMGFNNIYLFGVDNGYLDKEHHHSKHSLYYDDEGNTKYEAISVGNEMRIRGNFHPYVYSDHFMYTGKVQMERLLASIHRRSFSCFNCSNGAYIEGAPALNSDDIIIEKPDVDKAKVVDIVKNRQFSKYEKLMHADAFVRVDAVQQVCDELRAILLEPVFDKKMILEQVLKQVRFVYSFNKTELSHIFLVLEGEILYVSSIMINMVFNFGDGKSILPFYADLKAIWLDFLEDLPSEYSERLYKLSDHDFKFK